MVFWVAASRDDPSSFGHRSHSTERKSELISPPFPRPPRRACSAAPARTHRTQEVSSLISHLCELMDNVQASIAEQPSMLAQSPAFGRQSPQWRGHGFGSLTHDFSTDTAGQSSTFVARAQPGRSKVISEIGFPRRSAKPHPSFQNSVGLPTKSRSSSDLVADREQSDHQKCLGYLFC